MKNQATLAQDTVFTENNKKLPLYPARLLLLILLCTALTGLLPQTVLSVIILGASLLLFGTKQIYLVFPVMLFYYSPFGLLAGMSVYRFFTLIFLLIAFVEAKTLRIHKSHLLPFFIFTVYCIVVLMPDGVRRAVFACLDIFCVLVLIQHYLKKPDNVRRFFAIYALVAVFSFITGLIMGKEGNKVIIGGEVVELIRYTATFEDPNYMGFFFTMAVFSMLTLKLFHPKLRVLLIITLYAMMLATLSITMIVVNALLWILYLFIAKKLNFKTILVCVIILAILISLYNIGLSAPDTPVLGTLAYRIQEKLTGLFEDDLNSVTTGRTNLTLKHWEYFKEQSLFKMLIGMNGASPLKVEGGALNDVAHNEYVDLLLNVGILGTAVYLGFFVLRIIKLLSIYRKNKDREALCLFMIKSIWLLYGMTLTMFGDFRFSFFFFL